MSECFDIDCDYDALVDTVDLDDIASDEDNGAILQRLKSDEPTFGELWISPDRSDEYDFCPKTALELGWLGYFAGKSTHVEELYLDRSDLFHDIIEPFFRGLRCNESLKKMKFIQFNLDGSGFQELGPLFKTSSNLAEFSLERCAVGPEGSSFLSSALGQCENNSLEFVELCDCDIHQQLYLNDIILAMRSLHRLNRLELNGNNMGNDGCSAVATLLQSTPTELQVLDLGDNAINDDGMEILAHALLAYNMLRELRLYGSQSITTRGWESLSNCLRAPGLSLQELYMERSSVNDEAASYFAKALRNNHVLKVLMLYNNAISTSGWSAFSDALCDSSSVEMTFLSNHTIENLCTLSPSDNHDDLLPSDVRFSLEVNQLYLEKKIISMVKILRYHDDFDVEPFFTWGFKMLPLLFDWYKVASTCRTVFEKNIGRRKLSSIYRFIRGMPALYIECACHE